MDDVLAVQVLQRHQDLEDQHGEDWLIRMASDQDEEHEHDNADLGDEELGDPFGEAALLRRENHLQHVT